VLEGATIKLASVATDILGRSGRDMLVALVSGTSDAAALAQLARGRLREKIPPLEQALAGQFDPQQRFLFAQQLAHINLLDASLERVSAEIAERLRPFEPTLERLQTLPGVGRRTAQVLLAEIGADLSRPPSAGHFASWAGLCPGNDESAGKRRSGRTRKGSPWLRTALVEAAQAAARTQDTSLAAQDRRLAARRGAKRAAVAVAHTLLVMV
jgi:transposase